MPQLFRTKVWVVVLLSSACNTLDAKGKPGPRREAGARAAEGGRPAGRCVDGEMSVPHSPEDPCPQNDPACLAAGGTAFASCEGGTWAAHCVCITPQLTSPASAICGDGLIQQPTEQCDRTDLNQATCVSLGFRGGGTLLCNPTTCVFDTQLCR